ncbi:unnamed protein product [Rodentolepis nana]|uniref:RNA polymerase II nuclear localization protein SLC7A6OS n=1 Tax=Rodentolepis nana TaxID=102285 RepID=A0A0R3TNR5_RODNA|nr:unnamed protein product [Rodentolepis nana]
MDANGEVLLRVKRRCTEPPVEFFNTVPAKRRCPDNEPTGVAHFKYLGTSSSTCETVNIALEDLRDVGATGERKIILSTKHVAHILDSSQDAVQCEVRISSAQCRGLKRKAEVSEDGAVSESPPNKCIRIIDLSVNDQSALISSALNNIRVDPENVPLDVSSVFEDKLQVKEHDNDSGFVYDLYAVTPDTVNAFDLYPILSDEDSDEYDRYAFRDDESDPNSESNWRNDYPDEESLSSSCSENDDAVDELWEKDDYDDVDGDDDDDRYGFIY